MTDRAELKALLKDVQHAAYGDSNDSEIDALSAALDKALERWPGLQRNYDDPDAER